jgi:hypothetical protein
MVAAAEAVREIQTEEAATAGVAAAETEVPLPPGDPGKISTS